MGKLIVVEQDTVQGTDTHNVSGSGMTTASPPTPATYTGSGSFDYAGKMTNALSDFVKIGGKPAAVKTSKSSLNPGESASGKHSGPMGKNITPTAPIVPTIPSLKIIGPVDTGTPSATSGSSFVKIGGTAVLLDGDKIDTCDSMSTLMNSTVTAVGQAFVSCSA